MFAFELVNACRVIIAVMTPFEGRHVMLISVALSIARSRKCLEVIECNNSPL
jgi:hypothetical protein